jgi:hypothetical protein
VELAKAPARMSKMAIHRLGITPASGPENRVRRKDTYKEVIGHLATLSYFPIFFFLE